MSVKTVAKAKKPAEAEPETDWSTGLVGRCFHVMRKRKDEYLEVQYQGIVRAKVRDDVYLVQYFEWFMGSDSTLELATVEQMLKWQFYEDAKHMRFWHEYRYCKPDPEPDPEGDDPTEEDDGEDLTAAFTLVTGKPEPPKT